MVFFKKHIVLVLLAVTAAVQGLAQDKYLPNQEIVHTVVKGQTLYSIARSYQLKVEDVAGYNDGITADGEISPAQKVRIPIIADDNEKLDLILSKLQKKARTHKVAPQETVFALSQKYGISTNDLQQWNDLEDNNIGIGQDLIVGWEYHTVNSADVVPPTVKPVGSKPTVLNNPSQGSVNKQDMLYQKFLADKEGKSMQSIKGAANWFETENRMMASNYYGMLSGVPVGSIVQVVNPQNNKKVYVKIIGKLPDTAENTGATIKLTPVAQSALGAGNAKLHVEVNYYN